MVNYYVMINVKLFHFNLVRVASQHTTQLELLQTPHPNGPFVIWFWLLFDSRN